MTWSNDFTFNYNILAMTLTRLLPKMVNIGPELGQKCLFSLFLWIIFDVFAKTFFKTVQSFTIGHDLKFLSSQKNIFAGQDSQGALG